MAIDYEIKNRIADALKQLSTQKSISKITISDISRESGINRSTFYYHFTDRDDLILWIFKNDITDYFVQAKKNTWTFNTYRLLDKLHQDYAFYSQALKIDGNNSLRQYIFDITYEKALEYAQSVLNGRKIDKADLEFAVRYHAHAFTEMNIEYIMNGAKNVPDDELQRYFCMAEPCFKLGIENLIIRS